MNRLYQHTLVVSTILASMVTSATFSLAEAEYPRADLLVEPAELAKPEAASKFVILDVRGEEAYNEAHIPNAHRVDHDTWKTAFADEDAAAWSQRIGKLGIGKETPVVIYDEIGMKDAARVWWLLKYWGVEDVRLLNGGWKLWVAMDLPQGDKTTPAPDPVRELVEFKAIANEKRLTEKDQILKRLDGGNLQIVDARSLDEFCGIDQRKNEKGGAIPTAKHLEWSDLIDMETHRFKSPSEIRSLLEKAGIDPKLPTATHCQSGGRASVMAFGLELMGGEQVQNYYQGWSEWGNAENTPVNKTNPDKTTPEQPDDTKIAE